MMIAAYDAIEEAEAKGEQAHPIMQEIVNFPYIVTDSGSCTQLDTDGKCIVYEHRPLLCNVERMYETYWSGVMTREEWDHMNAEACLKLKESASLKR